MNHSWRLSSQDLYDGFTQLYSQDSPDSQFDYFLFAIGKLERREMAAMMLEVHQYG